MSFDLHFDAGELAARRAAGEWAGRTVVDDARARAEATPEAVAILEGDAALTFGEAMTRADALARGLRALGLKPGDSVAFQLPNWLEAGIVNLACAAAGLVVTPIVPIYRQAELRVILRDSRARAIFVPSEFRGVDHPAMIEEIRGELPDLVHVIPLRGGAPALAELEAPGPTLDGPKAEALKLILYTSGTTGRPKGVLHTHDTQRRAIMNCYEAWGLPPRTTVLMPSPVAHTTGHAHGLEAPFHRDARAVLMDRWDPDLAVELIDREGAGYTVGATPFLAELLDAAERAGSRLPSLRVFACGGAAVPPDLIRRADALFENGVAFRVYGASECPMVTQGVTGRDPSAREAAATTDGRIHDWEVRTLDREGTQLPRGREGEIAVRGPARFRGYTDPAETGKAIDAEGFFRTGDLGVVAEDGTITVTGRLKDLIIRGGENLSAKEIEDALHAHAAVAEAAVVAFPHPRLGEGVCACLVLRPGRAAPDLEELRAFLTGRGLARQKCPERVEILAALPKTASGKVQKHVLRSQVADDRGED